MHPTGSPRVRDALRSVGLDRFQGYVWGRAASLGEPEPGVVVAAFGVFEPQHLRAAYTAARTACPRATLVETRARATVASLHEVLAGEDVTGPLRALRRGVAAGDPSGRPLFAGLADQPWPADPLGQLWRACELLREHRGDTHLSVCVSEGLLPIEMNVLTELWLGLPLGPYTRTRGWSGDDIGHARDDLAARGLLRASRLTPAGRALRTAIEHDTSRGQQEIVRAVGSDVDGLGAALAHWSGRCIAAGRFTSDQGKRAAG
jgi:hypothetical protein